ncbi:hypothetical protein [Streptomyces violaceusniger]
MSQAEKPRRRTEHNKDFVVFLGSRHPFCALAAAQDDQVDY